MRHAPRTFERSSHLGSRTPLLLALALAACQSSPPPKTPPTKIRQSKVKNRAQPQTTTQPTAAKTAGQGVKATAPAPKVRPKTRPKAEAKAQKLPGRAIPKQTFQVDLPPFGKATFSPREISDGPGELALFLTRGSKILYRFPKPRDISWAFDSLVAVTFRDVNKDARKDVLLITKYMSGVGPGGAEPFFVTQVYLNGGGTFSEDPGLVKKLMATTKIHSLRKLTTTAQRFFKRAKK